MKRPSKKEILVAVAKGSAGMVPLAGPLLQELVGLAARERDDKYQAPKNPIWLVMAQSYDKEPVVFWQIAVAAKNPETAQRIATDLVAEQGRAFTQVDTILEMKEDKALADPESDFALLFLAASARGSAAIQLVGGSDEDK